MHPQKSKFIHWLITPYLIIIRSEDNLEIKTTLRFRKSDLMVIGLLIFLILQSFSLFLTYNIRKAWINPRYAEFQTRKQLIDLSGMVDSLTIESERKENYFRNLKKIMAGKDIHTKKDSFSKVDITNPPVDIARISPADSALRKQFESENTLPVFEINSRHDFGGVNFFPPVKGIVTENFSIKQKHFGTDIVTKMNEPVKAVLDGIVILSSWTEDSGNIIALQHKNNLISFYKHNSSVLKPVGSYVTTGEVISIVGNTGELTTGPHLHFELWKDGNAINPEDFINFE